jgi:hypothetical protein
MTTQSDVATGTTGTITNAQTFNETRAVCVKLRGSAARQVQSLVLRRLNLGSPGRVGARIYDGTNAGGTLIASADVNVAAGPNQVVDVPVSATLLANTAYYMSFYVETTSPGDGSGDFFTPSTFISVADQRTYRESSGVFSVHTANSIAADAFPGPRSMFVPQLTIVSAPPSVASDMASGTPGAILFGRIGNETRAVTVALIGSADRKLTKLVLRALSLSSSGRLGARIYDATTHARIAAADVTTVAGSNQVVEIPVSATLTAGKTYRIGFYVETLPQTLQSLQFFHPSGFVSLTSMTPYVDASGGFSIRSANASAPIANNDTFPADLNVLVPQMTIVTESL